MKSAAVRAASKDNCTVLRIRLRIIGVPCDAGGLEQRVEALGAAARMQAGAKAGTSSDLAGVEARLDPDSLEQVPLSCFTVSSLFEQNS